MAGTPDVDAQIGVLATLLVALIFSQRVVLSKKAGRLRWYFSAPPVAAGLLSIVSIFGWATGEIGGDFYDAILWLTWFAMTGALILSFSAWAALPGKKLKGDPFGHPRPNRRPSPPDKPSADK